MCPLPSEIDRCELEYWPEGESEAGVTVEVLLHEKSDDSDKSLLNHLRNLGFGAEGESTEESLFRYQRYAEIPVTGKLDEQTKASIKKAVHGGDDSVQSELGDDGQEEDT